MPAIAFRPPAQPLSSLHERAVVAAITTRRQHVADIAVRRVELRRERLGWAAIAFGSLEIVLPSDMPEWTAEEEPHWPLTDGARLLLRFGASPDQLRFSVLRDCACGTPTSTGRIDPRDRGAVAAIGEALQTRARCAGCRLGDRHERQQLALA